MQWYLQNRMSVLWSFARSSLLNMFSAFLSVSPGDWVFTIHILLSTLCTWVSTHRYGAHLVTDRKTFAVLIPTPGRAVSSSIVSGGMELCSAISISHVLKMFLALLLKNETDEINSVISSTPSFTQSSGVLRCWKKLRLIIFTCLSVAWADISIAMRSWKSLPCSSSVFASGYISNTAVFSASIRFCLFIVFFPWPRSQVLIMWTRLRGRL